MGRSRGSRSPVCIGFAHELIQDGARVAIAARAAGGEGYPFFAEHPGEGVGVLVAAIRRSFTECEERARSVALARNAAGAPVGRLDCQPGFLPSKKRELASKMSAAKMIFASRNWGVIPKSCIVCFVPAWAAALRGAATQWCCLPAEVVHSGQNGLGLWPVDVWLGPRFCCGGTRFPLAAVSLAVCLATNPPGGPSRRGFLPAGSW